MITLLLLVSLSGEAPPQPLAPFQSERACLAAAEALTKEHAVLLQTHGAEFQCFSKINGERV